jgi:hypothetical protein
VLTKIDRGFSGTWVVSNGEAIGMIVAVYDNQPYVHIIPMASVFPSIRNVLRERLEDPEVRIKSTVINTASDLELSEAQPHLVSGVTRPKHRLATQRSNDRLAAKLEKRKKNDVTRPASVPGSVPRMESQLNIVRKLPPGLFVPMSLMVLAIGLVSHSFRLNPPSTRLTNSGCLCISSDHALYYRHI